MDGHPSPEYVSPRDTPYSVGHNHVGCGHLLIGLAAEPDGTAGELLRSRGVDGKATRRAVDAALEGYAHLRATNPAAPHDASAPAALLNAALAPIVKRIEALESRLG